MGFFSQRPVEKAVKQEKEPDEEQIRDNVQKLINEAVGARTTGAFSSAPIKAEKLIEGHGFKIEDFGISKEELDQLIFEHSTGVIKEAKDAFEKGEFEKAFEQATQNIEHPFTKQLMAANFLLGFKDNIWKIRHFLNERFDVKDPKIVAFNKLADELGETLSKRMHQNPIDDFEKNDKV